MILLVIFFLIPLILCIPYDNENHKVINKERKYDPIKLENKHKELYTYKVNNCKLPRKKKPQVESITQFFELNKKKRENLLREKLSTNKKLREHKRYKTKNKDRFLSQTLDTDPRLLELTEYNETTFY
tara:strand:- start:3855 stop:4238 length:384 start_codon:yes stop_codon:yes gene_type:complete